MVEPKNQPIGEVLLALMKGMGEQHGVLSTIQQHWGHLVGKRLATHAKPVSFRRGRLVIVVERPGDGFVLNYQRTQLLEQLRQATGGKVTEMVFRPGGQASRPGRKIPRTRKTDAVPH